MPVAGRCGPSRGAAFVRVLTVKRPDDGPIEEHLKRFQLAALGVLLATFGAGCGGASEPGTGTSGGASVTPLDGYTDQEVSAQTDANGGADNSIYPLQIQVWGGSPRAGYSWTMTAGQVLPVPNLLIDALTGVVHGTVPNGFPGGVYPFSVTVSDGSGTIELEVFLTVTACDSTPGAFGGASGNACGSPVGAFSSQGTAGSIDDILQLATIPTGKAFGFNFSATGGVLPYTWQLSSGTLPAGLVLNASTGTITGSAFSSAAGNTYDFTVSASDAAGTALVNPNDPSQPALSYSMTL